MLSSNMKNEQHTTFQKKLQAKETAKIKLFMLSLIQSYFLRCITFFDGLFLQFFQKFCTQYKILHDLIPNFNFFNYIFLRSYLYFLETFKPKKEERPNNIEFFF